MSNKITFGDIINWLKYKMKQVSIDGDANYKFRVLAYLNVIKKIENKFSNNDVATDSNIESLGLTEYMSGELKKFIVSGAKKYSQTILPGLGPHKIKKILDENKITIQQIIASPKKYLHLLPLETQTFLIHKPINNIPYDTIKQINDILNKINIKNTKLYIVGSHRRKKKYSKDIDVMLVSGNENVLDDFIKSFNKKFPNKMWIYSKGPDKISTIVELLNIKFKMDIFRTPIKCEYAMLLYATGSKTHNIKMRKIAKKKGYLLNQCGLFKNNVQVPNLKSEKDYFDILGLDYLKPEDRD